MIALLRAALCGLVLWTNLVAGVVPAFETEKWRKVVEFAGVSVE